MEIFERRNLVAHQQTRVTNIYLKNCSEAGLDTSALMAGQRLRLTPRYLKSSVNILLEFGILLLFVIWRKRFKRESDEAFSAINEIAFDLIKNSYVRTASRVLEFALFKQTRRARDVIIKMMLVNLANCYKKLGDTQKVEEVLSGADWSSASDQFKISIAAIHDDVEAVVSMMPRVKEDDEVGKDGFRIWPVFDGVRSLPAFKAAFQETFGEPIGRAEKAQDGAKSGAPTKEHVTEAVPGPSGTRH